MRKKEKYIIPVPAEEFIKALLRQVEGKSLFKDGINTISPPLELIASIAEELGEVATDYVRGRTYGAVAECIDVAHSALLLAISIDKDGEILKRLRWNDENNKAL